MLRSLTPSLGAIALLTTSGSLALNIIIAVETFPVATSQRGPAIIACILQLANLGLLSLSVIRILRTYGQDERLHQECRTGPLFLAILWFLSFATTLGTLIGMHSSLKSLHRHILGSSTQGVLVGALVLCTAFALFEGLYVVLLVVKASRKPVHDMENSPSMHPIQQSTPALRRYSDSITSSPPSSPAGNRKRAESDIFPSMNSELPSIHPVTSKTRLLSRLSSLKSTRSARSTSTNNDPRPAPPATDISVSKVPPVEEDVSPVSMYDSFDSWDTSAVSLDSRQTISESSPKSPFATQLSPKPVTHAPPPLPLTITCPLPTLNHSHSRTFLPTIPASPVVSRTPSPAFALDAPVQRTSRHRSRSDSPANSFRSTSSANRRHNSLQAPPPISDEANIHPLYRSDSPTPPPAVATPGTNVRAAPNAGRKITESERVSLRRMRSESVISNPQAPSPLVHTYSFDSVSETNMRSQQLLDGANKKLQMHADRSSRVGSVESDETRSSSEVEGSSPIPEWVLGAAARSSLDGYQKRSRGNSTVNGG